MKRTQVYFDPADYRQIEVLAAKRGLKKAEMTRRVIKAGIKVLSKKDQASNLFHSIKQLAEEGEKVKTRNPDIDSSTMDKYLYGSKSKFNRHETDFD